MQELNPVRGIRGAGDPLLRTRVIRHLSKDHETLTSLAEAVDSSPPSVSQMIEPWRDEGLVDGLDYTVEGRNQVRKVQRALINQITVVVDGEPDQDELEKFIGYLTGLTPHEEPVGLETSARQALKWLAILVDQRGLDIESVLDIDRDEADAIEITSEQEEWLRDRDHPFYLDDCPHDVPTRLVEELHGGLYKVKDEWPEYEVTHVATNTEPASLMDDHTPVKARRVSEESEAAMWLEENVPFMEHTWPFDHVDLEEFDPEVDHLGIVREVEL